MTMHAPQSIIKAQRFRSQEQNKEDALARLVSLIKKANTDLFAKTMTNRVCFFLKVEKSDIVRVLLLFIPV